VSVDFAAGVNTTVRGVYVSKEYWFELSEDWQFSEPSTLDLRFTHSPILVKQLSSLTVAMNGSPVQSIFLDPTNERHGSLVVQIPGRRSRRHERPVAHDQDALRAEGPLRRRAQPGAVDARREGVRSSTSTTTRRSSSRTSRSPGDYSKPRPALLQAKERIHGVILIPSDPTEGGAPTPSARWRTLLARTSAWAGASSASTNRENPDPACFRDRQIIVVGGVEFLRKFEGAPWNLSVGRRSCPRTARAA